MLTVSKFGGSSLAGSDGLDRVSGICARTLQQGSGLAVVVSARGETTDELLSEADSAACTPHPRELDFLLSTGEMRSAAALAMKLRDMGIDALALTGIQAGIRTDSRFGEADILSIDTSYLNFLISHGKVPVVCGFQGGDEAGNITTLGRGGSDTTAAALAAALNSDECRIYTDVNGVFTADPRIVGGCRQIPVIDSFDMYTLSRFGCGVLHPRAADIAMMRRVPLRILSSFSPDSGTLVAPLEYSRRPDFAGITLSSHNTVTIVGKAAVFYLEEQLRGALSRELFNILSIDCGENFISVRLENGKAEAALRLLHAELFG